MKDMLSYNEGEAGAGACMEHLRSAGPEREM